MTRLRNTGLATLENGWPMKLLARMQSRVHIQGLRMFEGAAKALHWNNSIGTIIDVLFPGSATRQIFRFLERGTPDRKSEILK